MNKVNRILRAVKPHWILLGTCFLFMSLCALIVHPVLGMIAFVLTCVVWPVLSYRKFISNWVPNVRGENAYQILGVRKDADAPTIRKAFRNLEAQYHPDAVPPEQKAEATLHFIRINQAYELLGDTEKRFQYDGLLEESEGVFPPFEEAYAQIKDEHRHPIYAEYDALYTSNPDPGPREWDADGAPTTPSATQSSQVGGTNAHLSPPNQEAGANDTPTSEGDELVIDVEIPESIREMMGSISPPPAPSKALGEHGSK
jgi:hypothetical protein